jgi:hypothetical protein
MEQRFGELDVMAIALQIGDDFPLFLDVSIPKRYPDEALRKELLRVD